MLTDLMWFDYLLLAVLAISTVISLFRGFLREALSLLGWVLAIWAAWRFGMQLADQLVPWVKADMPRLWLARGAIIVLVLLLSGLVSALLRVMLHSTGLSGTDRAAGMIFGFGRGVLLAGVLIVMLEAAGFQASDWWVESQLVPYAAPVTDMIRHAAEDGLVLLDEFELPQSPD